MTQINKLPTMTYHFFEKPNKLFLSDDGFTNVIIAEVDETFNDDFILDAKSFDLLKKLSTDRKVEVKNNCVYIKSKEGKFKCNKIEKTKPAIHIDNIVYENNYKVSDLKNAINFVSTNQSKMVLCGVLFNDLGEVYATDSFKFYYDNIKHNEKTRNYWSLPTKFIKLLSGEYANLQFCEKKVIYNGEYQIITNIYDSNVPDLKMIVERANSGEEIVFNKTKELSFFQSEMVEIIGENGKITFNFFDDEMNFKVEYECNNTQEFTKYSTTNNLLSAFNIFNDDKISLKMNENMMTVNDKVIICYIKKV